MIAQTTFGKGVSFMESRIEWHYLPLSDEHYAQALEELDLELAGSRSRLRAEFAAELVVLAREDPRVTLLTGDLGFTVLEPFAERVPRPLLQRRRR